MLVPKGLLYRVQLAVRPSHRLDGGHFGAFGLQSQHIAAFDGPAIEVHGAGAALRGVAAHMGAGQTAGLAQVLDQKGPLGHLVTDRLAVDRHGNLACHTNRAPYCASSLVCTSR